MNSELEELLRYLTPLERAELVALGARDSSSVLWRPTPGPQLMAYISDADILGFGGSAGGGKTDLAIGLGLTNHHKTLFVRQHTTELTGIYDRLGEILGSRDFKDQYGAWRVPGGPYKERIFNFGSLANPGDEQKQQGKPKDLLVLEEAANMLEIPVRFLCGWVRSAQGVRTKILMTFNPPTTSEGRWIIGYYAPWIDKRYAGKKAQPGELRWFVGVPGNPDYEVPDERARVLTGGRLATEFNPREFKPEEILNPRSRTFIPSRVSDNPYLAGTPYIATLQALPEPLRSQMLYGDFNAGIKDNEWQVIPTSWVDAAVARWQPKNVKPRMISVGVDVARGGDDNTLVQRLHDGNWFDVPLVYPGAQTPDGPTGAGLVVASLRDQAPIHVDVIGVGASVYDHLKSNFQTIGVHAAEAAPGVDKSGRLTFANVRSWMWWSLREALDPNSNLGIALPNDQRLIADLTTPRWELRGKTIYIESREDLLDPKRLGRSPDWGTAACLAWIRTPRRQDLEVRNFNPAQSYDPYHGMSVGPQNTGHNPYG